MSLQNAWAMNQCPFINYLWLRCHLNWLNSVGFCQELEQSDPQGKKIISVRLFTSKCTPLSAQNPAVSASPWPVVSSLTILISRVISMPESETWFLDSLDGQWREETGPSQENPQMDFSVPGWKGCTPEWALGSLHGKWVRACSDITDCISLDKSHPLLLNGPTCNVPQLAVY